MMQGGSGQLEEAKIIAPGQMKAIIDRLREYAKASETFERDLAFVDAASQTGLRVSEVAHLKKEDILDGRLIVTRRKKKVLTAKPIPVNPDGLKRIREWAERVKSGYIFPGAAAPCFIHRRPKFEAQDCPDCGKRVAPLSMIRKKSDRIAMFFQHLNVDHKRSADEVQEWIDFASVEKVDQFCPGGHLSIRHFQGRWKKLMLDLDIYKFGRGVHCIRHASVTRLYNKTRDIRAAQEFAGHESIEMTKRYCHVDLEEKLASVPVDW